MSQSRAIRETIYSSAKDVSQLPSTRSNYPRPPSPPLPPPAPLPIRGAMRRRAEFLKEQEEERALQVAAERAREEERNRGTQPAGLGYGPNHPSYFSYTRNAKHGDITSSKGCFQPHLTGRQLAEAGCTDPHAFAATKTRYYDPVSMATPQALGYGRSHRHFFQYIAPVLPQESDKDNKH